MNRPTVRRLIGLFAALLALPALASCAVESLDPSGNGTQVIQEGIRIENATIVGGDEGSGKAAFLGTIFNTSDADEQIVSITADGQEASLKPASVDIEAADNVMIQTGKDTTADFSGLTANEGTYVEVTVKFKNAGEAKFQSLVVPPVGFYADAAPAGTSERDNSPAASVKDESEAHGSDEAGEETNREPIESGDDDESQEGDATALEERNDTATS